MQDFAKVGKSFLRRVTGVQDNYKIVEKEEIIDWENCSECPMYKVLISNKGELDELILDHCKNNCKRCISYKEKTIYHNESNEFKIPKTRERLSKTQIKQILLYHFLGVDKNGVVKNINEKFLAKYLGCDIKTVRNNNERFVELNYIILGRVSDDTINIILVGYKDYYLNAYEGGRGYITIHKDLLDEFIKIDNVNTLRLEIRQLIKFDDLNIGTEDIKEASYTYKEIKRFLPDYLNYKGAIDNIVKQKSGAFDVTIKEKEIKFKLKDKYIGKNIKDIVNENNYAILMDYCGYEGILLTTKDEDDLLQMGLQYGIDSVMDALSIVNKNYFKKGIIVRNIGGLVRSIIKDQVS